MREDALAGFLSAYSKQRARVQALVSGDSGSGSGAGAGSAGESKSTAAAGEEESKADSAGTTKAAAPAKHIPGALKPFHGKVLKPAELAELYGAWSGLFAP